MPVFRRDGRSVLFIHVPKTGGTSVEQQFRASGWTMDFFDAKSGRGAMNNLRWCRPQHLHGVILKQLFRLDRFDLVFAVVREPVARFRSEYVWRNRKLADMPTDAESVGKWAMKMLAAYHTNPYLWDNHFRPQHEFLVPGARVLRLEDGLSEGLSDLSDRHDLGLEGDLQRFKDSQDGPRRSSDVEISGTTKLLLRRVYRKDFRTFGYPRP